MVPLKTSTAQLYVIQQRLLSVVNPELAKSMGGPGLPVAPQSGLGAQRAPSLLGRSPHSWTAQHGNRTGSTKQPPLLPGYLIVEGQPLLVNCNISDEFVLRRLRENPQFQLAWYKNGKQLKGSMQLAQALPNQPGAGQQTRHAPGTGTQAQSTSLAPRLGAQSAGGQSMGIQASGSLGRVQFLQANGRQMYISSAQYSDAGEYLCSWSKLPISRQVSRAHRAQLMGSQRLVSLSFARPIATTLARRLFVGHFRSIRRVAPLLRRHPINMLLD